jgi:hypothetical protein
MPITRGSVPPVSTFIIRFWHETGTGPVHWRGQVKHIQSGESTAFADEATLLNFLRRWVPLPEEEKGPPE